MGNPRGRGGGARGSDGLVYLLPKDTAPIVANNIDRCTNLGLILARYVPQEVIENADIAGERNAKWRDRWLRERCNAFSTASTQLQNLVAAMFGRWEALTRDAQRFTMENQGRLLIGLGGESVLETGLTVQHLTGMPYVPGSALKGLCRTYALMVIGAEVGILALSGIDLQKHEGPTPLQQLDEWLAADDETRQISMPQFPKAPDDEPAWWQKADAFREIFGSQDLGGACVFYDGVLSKLPAALSLFELDVMTPHFPDYYTSDGRTPPTDDQNPNPINFLTVAAGCEFAFAVGLRSQKADRKDLSEQASTWLRLALHELGVGAKTASGYGVFYRPKF